MDREMMKGIIDLLILSLISQRDLYGYEITKIIKRLSGDAYDMSEGTMYSALKRLERKQLWRRDGNHGAVSCLSSCFLEDASLAQHSPLSSSRLSLVHP